SRIIASPRRRPSPPRPSSPRGREGRTTEAASLAGHPFPRFFSDKRNCYHAPPMSLASALTPFINSKVRKRGVHYFNAGHVRITACGPEAADAVVAGSSLYEVSLFREGKILRAFCSCPFAERGEACKHVWAALLAVDAKGGLRGRDGSLPQRLETEAVENDFEAEDEDPDLEGWENDDFEDEGFD